MPGEALLDLVYGSDRRDRKWMRNLLCRAHHDDVPPSAWTCDDGPKSKVMIAGVAIHGFKAQQLAAMICFNCPAQYDCARFAFEGDERAGVWSMTMRDLKWFGEYCNRNDVDGIKLIDGAEAMGVAVQVMVGGLRAAV